MSPRVERDLELVVPEVLLKARDINSTSSIDLSGQTFAKDNSNYEQDNLQMDGTIIEWEDKQRTKRLSTGRTMS